MERDTLASVPRSTALGHQLWLWDQKSISFPIHSPKEVPKSQKSPWREGKGMAGPYFLTPCLASQQQSKGKASRAPLPRWSWWTPESHETCPNPGLPLFKPMLCTHPGAAKAGVPAAVCQQPWSEYQSLMPLSFASRPYLSYFLRILGPWQQAGDFSAVG